MTSHKRPTAKAPRTPEKAPDHLADGDELSSAALRALAAAVTHRRIYPPQHPIAARALVTACGLLERLLASQEEWRVAVVGRRILAGGRALEDPREGLVPFLEDLKARGFETIAFKRGVGPEEMQRFLSLLALDAKALGETPMTKRLATEGFRFIEAGRLVLEDPDEAARSAAALEEAGSDAPDVYDGAVSFIKEAILGFQEGRAISLREAEAFVQTMVDNMQKDRSPFLILSTLKSHHAYTFTHIINVCILTLAQVEALGADARTLREFGLASMMHDIGKSLVPREILAKPGKLTPEEFALMQKHPHDGVHILRGTPGVPDLAMIVAFEHHMRYNHGGYPRLRRARPLHPCSLMTNLADTYDAMRSRRSYQLEFPPEKVATLIQERAGTDFHPQLARAFLQIMGAYPPGTRVKLDTGEEGLVVRASPDDPYRPMVRILRDSAGAPVRRLEVVDLADKEAVGGRYARSVVGSLQAPSQGEAAPTAA